jgi:hypothetical protein
MGTVSIKGVLIGGTVDVVSSFILGIPFEIYILAKVNLAHTPPNQISSALAATHASLPVHLGGAVVGVLCSVPGGYVAARVAGHSELLNGTLASWLCVLIAIYAMMSGKSDHPLFVQILLLAASPALGCLGGYLKLRQSHALSAPV